MGKIYKDFEKEIFKSFEDNKLSELLDVSIQIDSFLTDNLPEISRSCDFLHKLTKLKEVKGLDVIFKEIDKILTDKIINKILKVKESTLSIESDHFIREFAYEYNTLLNQYKLNTYEWEKEYLQFKQRNLIDWDKSNAHKFNLFDGKEDFIKEMKYTPHFIAGKNNQIFGPLFMAPSIYEIGGNSLFNLFNTKFTKNKNISLNKKIYSNYKDYCFDKENIEAKIKKKIKDLGNQEEGKKYEIENLERSLKYLDSFKITEHELNMMHTNSENNMLFISGFFKDWVIYCLAIEAGLTNEFQDSSDEGIRNSIINIFNDLEAGETRILEELVLLITEIIKDLLIKNNISFISNGIEDGLTKQIHLLWENEVINRHLAFWLTKLLVDTDNGPNLRNKLIGHTSLKKYYKYDFSEFIQLICIIADLRTIERGNTKEWVK